MGSRWSEQYACVCFLNAESIGIPDLLDMTDLLDFTDLLDRTYFCVENCTMNTDLLDFPGLLEIPDSLDFPGFRVPRNLSTPREK